MRFAVGRADHDLHGAAVAGDGDHQAGGRLVIAVVAHVHGVALVGQGIGDDLHQVGEAVPLPLHERHGGQVQLPVAVIQLGQRVGGLVPVVEFAFQIQLVGAGCPLPVVPAAVNVMEAVVVVGVGEIVQGLVLAENPFLGGAVEKHSQVDVSGEGLELRVEFQ